MINMQSKVILFLVLISISLFLSAKEVYRYKNAQGNTIIKDNISNEMIELGYDVLSANGLLLKKVPPGKTLAEEIEDKQKILERKKEELERKQQIRRDAQLLRQFSSISDIIRNRDAQILGLEQRRKIQNIKADLLKLQLEDLQKQAATHERLGQKLPSLLQKDIKLTKDQMINNKSSSERLETEKEIVAERYQKDILRYKDLESFRKNLSNKNKDKDASRTVTYNCPDKKTCQLAWQLAQVYAKNNASGEIEIITNTLIITSSPEKDTDIALSFSRIPSQKNNDQIILDVTCNNTEKGADLCRSESVTQIGKGYLDFLRLRLN